MAILEEKRIEPVAFATGPFFIAQGIDVDFVDVLTALLQCAKNFVWTVDICNMREVNLRMKGLFLGMQAQCHRRNSSSFFLLPDYDYPDCGCNSWGLNPAAGDVVDGRQ